MNYNYRMKIKKNVSRTLKGQRQTNLTFLVLSIIKVFEKIESNYPTDCGERNRLNQSRNKCYKSQKNLVDHGLF